MFEAIVLFILLVLVRTNFSIKLVLILLVTLSGCLCRNTTRHDYGKLSTEALKIVPYQEGQVVKMKHSNGQLINFTVNSRITETVTENPYVEACYEETYEKNTTSLYPDYPVFNISFILSNQGGYTDLTAILSSSYFNIPLDSNQVISLGNNVEFFDTLNISDSIYDSVYKLNYYSWNIDTTSIFIEDIYYNCETGILKIDMSNNEFYTLYANN